MNRLTIMFRLFASRLRQQLAVGCLFLIAPASLHAQPILTLEEAIQEVRQHNKALQQARNGRQIDAYNNHISKIDFFPTLTLPSISAAWPESEYNKKLSWELYKNARLSKQIGLGWRLSPSSLFSYQTLRTQDQIRELKWQQQITEQIARTTKAYYSLALAQQKQQMEVNSLAIAKETLRLAKTKYEIGQATELDYLDAQVTYEHAKAQFQQQNENVANQKRKFSRWLGRDQFEAFEVVEEIALPESLDWDELFATYKANSPVLQLAKKQHRYDLNMLKLQQADQLFPSLGLNLTYTCWEKQPQYGVKLTLDFTNIFQYAINARKKHLEKENHRLTFANTQIDEEEKLRSEFLTYTQQLQSYVLQQRSVQVNEARAAEALEKYRLGHITLLELKHKQAEAQKAKQQCLKMRYEIKKQAIKLRAIAGMTLKS